MGYDTDFTGVFTVKNRKLVFTKSLMPNDNNRYKYYYGFNEIFTFLLYNDMPCKLHYIRLVSKDFYVICSKLTQSSLFNKVDQATVDLIDGIASSRRLIRYRYINGIDYGMDGQYYYNLTDINTINFCNKSQKYFEDGRPLDMNEPPRFQPGLWCKWRVGRNKQCIEWDGRGKFKYYNEWLVYLINHILHPRGYLLEGSVDWQGEDSQDQGVIVIKKNNEVQIIRKNTQKYYEDYLLERFSQQKTKNIHWRQFGMFGMFGRTLSEEAEKILSNSTNSKEWIENNKTLSDFENLMKAAGLKKAKKKKNHCHRGYWIVNKNAKKIITN